MIKTFQTIIDKKCGNCMQAAIASLFEIPLEEAPDFKKLKQQWFSELWKFIEERGYKYEGSFYNYLNNKRLFPSEKSQDRFNELSGMSGVHGYFYATVYSPKYYDNGDEQPITHAVIIDKNYNIVHHVNAEYNDNTRYPHADEIGYNGVLTVYLINPILK